LKKQKVALATTRAGSSGAEPGEESDEQSAESESVAFLHADCPELRNSSLVMEVFN